jgi:hypothetical protein
LDRGLSGVLVSYLRLLGEDYNRNDKAGELDHQHPYVTLALKEISHRAGMVTGSHSAEQMVDQMIDKRLDEWLSTAQNIGGGAILGYAARKDGRTLGLLKQPTEEDRVLFTCLNSLRDVEPSVKLILQDQGMDLEPGKYEVGEEAAAS